MSAAAGAVFTSIRQPARALGSAGTGSGALATAGVVGDYHCVSRPAASRDPRTDPRARFGVGHQPGLSVQAPRRGARPADPGPPSAAQRRRSLPLQVVPGRLDRGGRGLGSARRRARARAAVDRAGGPLGRARLPRRARRALLRLSPRTTTVGRHHDHRGRAGGHRIDQRRRRRHAARLAGSADRHRGRDLRRRRRAREDLDPPPPPAARRGPAPRRRRRCAVGRLRCRAQVPHPGPTGTGARVGQPVDADRARSPA